MDVRVDIKPEDVNKMMVDAILASTLGKSVQDAVKTVVDGFSSGWDSPLEKVIRKHLDTVILNVLHGQYKDVLLAQVQAALTGKITDDFIAKIVQKAFEAIYTDRR